VERAKNQDLNDLYSSPNIIRVIKPRRMRWVGHAARTGEGRGAYRVLVGKPEGRKPLGDPGIDGRIILGWISGSGMGVCGLDGASSGYGQVACACECGDEPSGSIKCREFLD
jgi:hypothetical protein